MLVTVICLVYKSKLKSKYCHNLVFNDNTRQWWVSYLLAIVTSTVTLLGTSARISLWNCFTVFSGTISACAKNWKDDINILIHLFTWLHGTYIVNEQKIQQHVLWTRWWQQQMTLVIIIICIYFMGSVPGCCWYGNLKEVSTWRYETGCRSQRQGVPPVLGSVYQSSYQHELVCHSRHTTDYLLILQSLRFRWAIYNVQTNLWNEQDEAWFLFFDRLKY